MVDMIDLLFTNVQTNKEDIIESANSCVDRVE